MKKLVFALMAVAALCACQKGGAPVDFNYRGLAFTMPVAQFVDSMTARGFAVDSAASWLFRRHIISQLTTVPVRCGRNCVMVWKRSWVHGPIALSSRRTIRKPISMLVKA